MTIMSSGTLLFFPWQLRWSKKKSRFYYYNSETKTSQWKRPPDPKVEPTKPLPDVKGSRKKSSHVIKNIGKMPGKGIKEKKQNATSTSSSVSDEQKSLRSETQQKPRPNATAAVSTKVPVCKTTSKFQPVVRQKTPTSFDDTASHEAAVEEEQMEVEESPEVRLIVEEIQGVRDEMQHPQTEELSMEVQMIVDCLSSVSSLPMSSTFSQKMFLVLDTNLFLEERGQFLLRLKAWIQKQSPPDFMVFVIPWIVLQELDRIKDDRYRRLDRPQSLRGKARKAVNEIHEWLTNRDPGVMGENPREAAEAQEIKNGFRIENNDDKILHCCLHYQGKYSVNQVALLTLDKNLRNKAMILGVNAFTRETLNNWLVNAFPNFKPIHVQSNPKSSSALTLSSQQTASSGALHSSSSAATAAANPAPSTPELFGRTAAFVPSCGRSAPAHLSTPMHLENPSAMEGDNPDQNWPAASEEGTGDRRPVDLKTPTKILETVMLDGLSAILRLSMEDAYKNLWERTLNMKRPWTIAAVVKAIDKFWIPVFKSFWHRNDLALMKDFAISVSACPESPSKLLELLETCRCIWTAFYSPRWSHDTKYAARYKDMRKEVLLNLHNLENCTKSLQDLPASVFPLEPTYSDDELQNVRDCFSAVLKQIISTSELLKMQLSSSTDNSNRQSLVTTYISMHRFMTDLHEQYQKAMLQSDDSSVYAVLVSSLTSFQIQTSITLSPISWQAMKGFFCDVSQTEVVQIGLSQIKSIVASVDEGCRLISQSEANYAAEHLPF